MNEGWQYGPEWPTDRDVTLTPGTFVVATRSTIVRCESIPLPEPAGLLPLAASVGFLALLKRARR